MPQPPGKPRSRKLPKKISSLNNLTREELSADLAEWGERSKGLTIIAMMAMTGWPRSRVSRLHAWLLHKGDESPLLPTTPKESEAQPSHAEAKVIPPPSVEERVDGDRKARRAVVEAGEWKAKYQTLLKSADRMERERDAALTISRAAREGEAPRFAVTSGSGTSTATAIVIASDWHVEEEVRPETINGRNRYNLDIAKRRAEAFFDRALRMIRHQSQHVKIETLVLGLLGDFISGNIHEELLETCLLQPVDASVYAMELIGAGIQMLLENSELQLVIPCKVGNHSRITRRIHHATETGNALETFIYAGLRSKFSNTDRAKFIIDESYHTYIDVGNRVVRMHHGHNVLYYGGVGGLTIPVNKSIAQWDKTERAHLDCFGHFHTYHPGRKWICNGSLIGFSPYAIAIKADYEPPMQAMTLLDHKRGVTVQIPIMLDDIG